MAASRFIGFTAEQKKEIFAERREKMAKLIVDQGIASSIVATRFGVSKGAAQAAATALRLERSAAQELLAA